MIRHVWSVLCRNSSIDETTNNVSLFVVLEQVGITLMEPLPEAEVDEKRTIPIESEIVSLWERTPDQPESGHARIRFKSPGGSVLFQAPPFELDLSKLRLRTRVKLGGFPFVGSGRYVVEVRQQTADSGRSRWKTVAQLPLMIDEESGPSAGED